MKRETLINVLLIIAGIVLAIALFGAGAFWKAKSSPKLSGQLTFDADYRERSSDKPSTARYLLGAISGIAPNLPAIPGEYRPTS